MVPLAVMIVFVLFLFGIIFGSFVNALVWRLHEQQKPRKGKRTAMTAQDLSILKGRSMCPHCRHELAAADLVPIFSWLWLRGRCRYCSKSISVQYPLVELATGVLFAVTYLFWPVPLSGSVQIVSFGFTLAYIVIFMALAVYDAKWYLLPNKLVFLLTGLASLQVIVVAVLEHDVVALWWPIAGAAVIYSVFWGLFQVSKGEWIGGGDVKLALALGLIAGSPLHALLVIFFASLLGTLASIPLLIRGRKGLTRHIPFGPYLMAATLIVVLFADTIAGWYQSTLL